MTTFITVLIILACGIMSFFILIQKPKGGGLSGTFGSIGTQVMGVKQSGDIMEKGTWYTMAIIAILSIFTVFTYDINKPAPERAQQQQQQAPAQQQQSQQQAAPQQGSGEGGSLPAPAPGQ